MKLIRVCTLGIALSLAASAGWAQGQGGGRPGGGRPGFGGFGGPGGGFFGGPGGGGLGMLLMMQEVQTELKLDDAQKDLLQQINQESFQKMRTMFPAPQPGGERPQFNREAMQEMQKKFAALRQDQDKKIGEVLDPKQLTRLKQLSIQQAGTRALARPEVADQLKLSADQKAKIEAAQTAERDAMQSIFPRPQEGQPFQPPSDEQRQQMRQKMQDLRSATDSKILGVLTDAQKKQFTTMQGAPFKFPEFRGFGGPGGRRPGGNN